MYKVIYSKTDQSKIIYPKRVFEVIHRNTHTKDECDYFNFTDPFYFN